MKMLFLLIVPFLRYFETLISTKMWSSYYWNSIISWLFRLLKHPSLVYNSNFQSISEFTYSHLHSTAISGIKAEAMSGSEKPALLRSPGGQKGVKGNRRSSYIHDQFYLVEGGVLSTLQCCQFPSVMLVASLEVVGPLYQDSCH